MLFKKHAWLRLDDDQDTFIAGNTISGTVTLDTTEATKVTEICLKFHGSGNLSWSVDSGQDKLGRDKTKTIKAETDFLDEIIVIWKPGGSTGYEDPEDNHKIAEGQHTFPWSFQLPISLPSSCENSEGHVRYHMKLNVDRPWALDWDDTKNFQVVGFCNLDIVPKAKEEVKVSGYTTAGYGCILKKRIDVKIHQPTRGITVMNQLPISIEVINNSPRNISYTQLQLKQNSTMKIASHYKTTSNIVFKHKEEGFPAGETSTWNDVKVMLPGIPSTGGSWDHVQMEYFFEFLVQTSWNGPFIKVEWPVIIGTHFHSDAIVQPTIVQQPYPTQVGSPDNLSPRTSTVPSPPYIANPTSGPKPYPTQPSATPEPSPHVTKQRAPSPPVDNSLPGVPSSVTPVSPDGPTEEKSPEKMATETTTDDGPSSSAAAATSATQSTESSNL